MLTSSPKFSPKTGFPFFNIKREKGFRISRHIWYINCAHVRSEMGAVLIGNPAELFPRKWNKRIFRKIKILPMVFPTYIFLKIEIHGLNEDDNCERPIRGENIISLLYLNYDLISGINKEHAIRAHVKYVQFTYCIINGRFHVIITRGLSLSLFFIPLGMLLCIYVISKIITTEED